MIKQQGKVLVITVLLLLTETNVLAQNNNMANDFKKINYMYPGNNGKIYNETVDQFYEALRKRRYPDHQKFYKRHLEFYTRNKHLKSQMDIALFKEIPNASINMREKLLFKEVEKFNYIIWDGIITTTYPSIEIKFQQTVSPYRQVYFFYSLKDMEKEFSGRYAVYDVKTKKFLTGGGIYIDKLLTIKK